MREIRMLRARGGDWKRGTVEKLAGAPVLDPTDERALDGSTLTGSSALRTPRTRWRLGADIMTRNGQMGRSAIDRPILLQNHVGATSPPT